MTVADFVNEAGPDTLYQGGWSGLLRWVLAQLTWWFSLHSHKYKHTV